MKGKLLVLVGILVLLGGNSVLLAVHSDYGCHDCHVVHRSGDPADPDAHGVPLWSTAQNSDGIPTFELYDSKTLDADVEQPDGPSKLCLGCHDGTYSFFQLPFASDSTAKFEPGTHSDLAYSHPISFVYDAALALEDEHLENPTTAGSQTGEGTIDAVLLDDQHKMQCSSCHDVHSSGIGEHALRWEYDTETHTDNVMCRVCHEQ